MQDRKNRVFLDDPQAIEKLEVKLEGLIAQKAKWKDVKKAVPRTYKSHDIHDQAWFIPQSIQNRIRDTKKKIAKIQKMQKDGVELERKATYPDGKKRFYYAVKAQ